MTNNSFNIYIWVRVLYFTTDLKKISEWIIWKHVCSQKCFSKLFKAFWRCNDMCNVIFIVLH